MDFFKIHDKYGKELRCPNTIGKYGIYKTHRTYCLLCLEAPGVRKVSETSGYWLEVDILIYSAGGLGGSVGCASDWRPGDRGFDPRQGQHHSFAEIDHEIFSMVILSLLLIQEGQLSVSGERMCTILVNRLLSFRHLSERHFLLGVLS